MHATMSTTVPGVVILRVVEVLVFGAEAAPTKHQRGSQAFVAGVVISNDELYTSVYVLWCYVEVCSASVVRVLPLVELSEHPVRQRHC